MTRREFALGTLAVTTLTPRGFAMPTDVPDAPRDYPAPKFQPKFAKPLLSLTLVRDFVLFAHYDLDMVKTLLKKEPMLLNATVDWGNGDFESALGGASHLGQHETIAYLLSQGARPDLFTAAATGRTDVVKAFLALEPKLADAKGPHGIPLVMHAKMGGDRAKETYDYLTGLAAAKE